MNWLRRFLKRLLKLLGRRKLRLGLYGPPNSGKTTLANRMCADWLGEEMGAVSRIAHETREVQLKEELVIKNEEGKTIVFSLADTPGIATRIDYEDFVKDGMPVQEAKQRAKEASTGVVQSIQWLEKMDCVILVMDSTKEPYNQVNRMLIESLQERKIPLLLVGNKIDLKRSDLDRIKIAFPEQEVIGISAKNGDNIDQFYERLFALTEKAD